MMEFDTAKAVKVTLQLQKYKTHAWPQETGSEIVERGIQLVYSSQCLQIHNNNR
jgi:hypothetical protein